MYEKLTDACNRWVDTFNAYPRGIIDKLIELNPYELVEITPPSLNDYVKLYDDDHYGEYGKIVETMYDGHNDLYLVKLDGKDDDVVVSPDEFDVINKDRLPAWGTMFSFNDSVDDNWLNGDFGGNPLQEMADCGFRIYEQEDVGYLFGIDGYGYDFFESHWIPFYKVRGIKWHDIDDTIKEDE